MPSTKPKTVTRLSPKARAATLRVQAARVMPAPEPETDTPLIALGRRYDEAHAEWRAAEAANREPSTRYDTLIAEARLRGGPTMEDIKAAWALPGVTEAHKRADETFGTAAELALTILKSRATTVRGLAVQARALIPHVWPGGGFEDDAALGDDEDMAPEAVRHFIESCCAAAGVDWQGRPSDAEPASTLDDGTGDDLPLSQSLLDDLDIASQSLADLLTLRDVADTICNVAYGLVPLPCSTPERGQQTVAGRFALWLAELACEVQDHAQTEARIRSPTNEDEVDRRLQTIAKSVAANGDPAETRALARDFEALAQMIEARSAARG